MATQTVKKFLSNVGLLSFLAELKKIFLPSNQGAINAGKFMMINSSGNVVPDDTSGITATTMATIPSKQELEFYLSTSNTSQTGSSWSTTPPTWVTGKFMWIRQKTTPVSGSITYSTPACVCGTAGGVTTLATTTQNGLMSATDKAMLIDLNNRMAGLTFSVSGENLVITTPD